MAAFRHVHLIDTAVASDNAGDEIIMVEVRRQIMPLVGDAVVTTSAGHDGLGRFGRDAVARADVVLLCGTNALSARFRLGGRFMWHVGLADLRALKGKVVLVGVGANRDFTAIDRRQVWLLRWLLSERHVHAVRDGTALRLLQAIGRQGVNTACPTLWSIDGAAIPQARAARVTITLTRHRADPSDARMLDTLLGLYDEVAFWPQQPRDLDYLRSLPGAERVRVLAPNLPAYDAHLAAAETDVVGTRLHGTIRGLHHRRRSLTVVVDNRARDIGHETGLPVIARPDMSGLRDRLSARWPTALHLPRAEITRFCNQFRQAAA